MVPWFCPEKKEKVYGLGHLGSLWWTLQPFDRAACDGKFPHFRREPGWTDQFGRGDGLQQQQWHHWRVPASWCQQRWLRSPVRVWPFPCLIQGLYFISGSSYWPLTLLGICRCWNTLSLKYSAAEIRVTLPRWCEKCHIKVLKGVVGVRACSGRGFIKAL